jgi:hypothetical protein
MKTRNFYAYPDSIAEFAEMLQEGELDGIRAYRVCENIESEQDDKEL